MKCGKAAGSLSSWYLKCVNHKEMSVTCYVWGKKIYFSNMTGLFFIGKLKNKLLTTHSLSSMTHQDGNCAIECKMSRRLEEVKVLYHFTAETTLPNCYPAVSHS